MLGPFCRTRCIFLATTWTTLPITEVLVQVYNLQTLPHGRGSVTEELTRGPVGAEHARPILPVVESGITQSAVKALWNLRLDRK